MVDRADMNGSPPTINTYKCCIKYYWGKTQLAAAPKTSPTNLL